MRYLVKPRLARMVSPDAARREFECAAQLLFRPPALALWLDGHWAGVGPAPLPVSHISWGAGTDRSKIILYFHGGAYIAGSPRTHRAMLAELSRQAGVPVVAPAYRLAPEAPFPAALEDARAAWAALFARGYDPDDIVLGGDSAGGGLALALLAELCAAGQAPAGAFALSPWVDLTGSGASVAENAARDPLLPASRMAEVAQMYLHGCDPRDPSASPLFARFDAPPPVLLQYGTEEILRDDALRIAARLRESGGEVTVQSWRGVPHTWQIFAHALPEARDALAQIGLCIRAWLRPRAPG